MDRRAEDMKSMGFFGIFQQSFKTIFSSKKLFAQITLTLILPLALIFIANIEISNHLLLKQESTLYLDFNTYLHNITVADWLYYSLFIIIHYTLLIVFSLLSTAAVIFTIASVYTNHNVVFMQVIKYVSKIWKKLFSTFVLIYLVLFINDIMLSVTRIISKSLINSISGYFFASTFFILYILGLLYLTAVLQLTSVVGVLENVYGFKAMKKGMYLLNGKKSVGMVIVFVLYVFLFTLGTVYALFVDKVIKDLFELAMIWRVVIGILIGTFGMFLCLLVIVIQTVLYLVCKAYHQEAVDKVSLSTFLESYLEESVMYSNQQEGVQLGRAQAQEV